VSFLRHLRAENLSPNTVDSYQESLKQLLEFLVSSGMPQESGKITREHV
jgi:site-specific recombinase XerC